jgi:hypothetical protein
MEKRKILLSALTSIMTACDEFEAGNYSAAIRVLSRAHDELINHMDGSDKIKAIKRAFRMQDADYARRADYWNAIYHRP